MLAEGLDAASAAFEVGYESASQFNREYKRFSVSRRCGTSKCVGSPAPQWSAINDPVQIILSIWSATRKLARNGLRGDSPGDFLRADFPLL